MSKHSVRGRNKCECGKLYPYHVKTCPECGAADSFSSLQPWDSRDWVYDCETYPNMFSVGFLNVANDWYYRYEISDGFSQANDLAEFLLWLRDNKGRLVGFNNVNFDHPIIHSFLTSDQIFITPDTFYQIAMAIINDQSKWGSRVPEWKTIIPQLDLYLIHHFDNQNKRTSLKMIEANMFSESVEDLPIPVGTVLDRAQKNTLLNYMGHDIFETRKFYYESIDHIEFRQQLGERFTNYSEAKIGSTILIDRLEEKQPGSCYIRQPGSNRKVPRQTVYNEVDLAECVFPYISFQTPGFQRVLEYFKSQKIKETKGVFAGLSGELNGLEFKFGLGGIHASVNNRRIEKTSTHSIFDLDVTSYYPSLAIANKKFPAHLGEVWYTTQAEMKEERRLYKKGTAANQAIKIAMNAAFGNTNSPFSPFYDMKYTMTITINGQLLLCMLAEQLSFIPGLEVIQANTDGLTVICPNSQIAAFEAVRDWWQRFTLLELEQVEYKRMFIRDVNNYIAESVKGKIKRKGAFEFENLDWHKDHSQLVVPRVTNAVLLDNADLLMTLIEQTNPYEFMLAYKCPGGSQLLADGVKQQRVTRYFVSNTGAQFIKESPPPDGYSPGQWKCKSGITQYQYYQVYRELPSVDGGDCNGKPWCEHIHTKNGSKYDDRVTEIVSGRKVTICNHVRDFNFANVDYDYYIKEIEKLTGIFL